jgi:WD40 repeat protein/tRNA A-37 threonylcarbamoyl transferase component Bud32
MIVSQSQSAMPSPQKSEEALFQAAVQLTGAERTAFLNGASLGDAAMRQRLEALLAAHDAPDELSPKDRPGVVATIKLELADTPDEAVGQTLGRYKLMERLGEGGCGVVYVAEQTLPVRRRVALKVIKLGMDTKQVVARFEAERQALAMMDHPNIAKVLDAGTTETGRPYFVMELVRGIRITEYCDQNNLTTKERLDLFIKVCQAIQHAHQKGIIHRDIKPSNILVTLHDGVPVPKVIDFGIAKATEGRLTDATVYTQLHQFIGTPAYMSPEQAEMSGLDIDTRSDIYSLGVLLYELLAGSTPFDGQELMSRGIDAMRKTIREQEPPRPSTRFATLKGDDLTTTAKRRSADKAKLMHQLKGDLDWIVMKCLEKDRTRRYDTANGLAADIKRHLNNEPVLARPPSAAYKFQKAFRRNKMVFTAGVAVAAALLLGIIASTWQSVRATRAKQEALAAQSREASQREIAEANEKKALAAQVEETKLRQQADAARSKAEAAELAARQRAYASDMNFAKQALDGNNFGRTLELLDRQRPGPGQKDMRGWEWRYLWQQTRSDALFTLCQESVEISSLAVSSDSHWLAVGRNHQAGLAVWDLKTRQKLIQFATNENDVRVAFSPTAPLLAFTSRAAKGSAKQRNTLRLWNAATRQMVAEIPWGNRCVGLAFAKDGRTLITSTLPTSSGKPGQLTLWRMPEGTRLASYEVPEQVYFGEDSTFAATPDLSLAAYALAEGKIRVVDMHNGQELLTAQLNGNSMAFSPDGKTMLIGAGDIRLVDVATGKETGRLEGHDSYVTSMVFWPDGKKMASSSADQSIRIWDMDTHKCLDVLRGSRMAVLRLALMPGLKTLVSGCKDGAVDFWDTSVTHPSKPLVTIPEDVVSWHFTSDSQSVMVLNYQGQVSRWSGPDFQQKEAVMEIGAIVEDPSWGYFYPMSSGGRFLACGSTNGVLQIWDLSRRALSLQWTNGTGKVWPKSFLPDGNKLVTWSRDDDLLHLWDGTTGLERQSWARPTGGFHLAFSPDGQACVLNNSAGDVQLRNLDDQSQASLNLDAQEGTAASYSPDGKLFAMGSFMNYARVWDTATWQPVATLSGFLFDAQPVTFSPDGKRLAVDSDGKEAVKLFDTESWQAVFTLEGRSGRLGSAFSPDGNAIGLNGGGRLQIWQAPSWAEINAAEAKEKTAIQEP